MLKPDYFDEPTEVKVLETWQFTDEGSYEFNKKGNLMNDVISDQMAQAQDVLDVSKTVQEEIRPGQEVFYTQSEEQVGIEPA